MTSAKRNAGQGSFLLNSGIGSPFKAKTTPNGEILIEYEDGSSKFKK
jgi:hypothetical protein